MERSGQRRKPLTGILFGFTARILIDIEMTCSRCWKAFFFEVVKHDFNALSAEIDTEDGAQRELPVRHRAVFEPIDRQIGTLVRIPGGE